jgi:hypothetical protein
MAKLAALRCHAEPARGATIRFEFASHPDSGVVPRPEHPHFPILVNARCPRRQKDSNE